MKKIAFVLLFAGSMLSGGVMADNQTISLGYAQSKVKDFTNLRGVNMQYRYEWNSPISLLSSISYMARDAKQHKMVDQDSVTSDVNVKYTSVLLGPAYRINDHLSLYASAGLTYVKGKGSVVWINNDADKTTQTERFSDTSVSLAYGVGAIVNLTGNITINVGYEGAKVKISGDRAINGFNIGIGYRF